MCELRKNGGCHQITTTQSKNPTTTTTTRNEPYAVITTEYIALNTVIRKVVAVFLCNAHWLCVENIYLYADLFNVHYIMYL